MEKQTDSELMTLVQAGDAASLADLFERHHVALFRYLFQLTCNRALSEDLTQEVFLRVLKYASTYNHELSFRAWIYGMARNASYDSHRKMKGEMADSRVLQEFRSRETKPEERIALDQHTRMLRAALDEMPKEKREVLELSRFQEMPYQEIAGILKCEVGAVKVRVHRALKDLREKFLELHGKQVA